MPLSAPAPRERFHTRSITCEGFARRDGLWDIEAHMTDIKGYAFANEWRGDIEPGTPIHGMWLRLTVDDDFVVRDVEAVTDHSPYEMCPAITPNFKRLIGLKIGPGWNRKVKERVGGIQGCTHLVELLAPMATVAFQTIAIGARNRRDELFGITRAPRPESADTPPPSILGTCHAWAKTSPVVARFAPDFFEDPAKEPEKID